VLTYCSFVYIILASTLKVHVLLDTNDSIVLQRVSFISNALVSLRV
jgi:hypothetical protein